MIRLAAGEDVPARAERADAARRMRSRCASTPRIRTRISAPRRPADRGVFPGRRARRHLGRDRHRGDAVLRSAARQGDRHAARPRRRRWQAARGARRQQVCRNRDQPRLSARHRRVDVLASGKVSTTRARAFAFVAGTDRCARARGPATVQDFPDGIGYWDVGVPPSGPMDDARFRLANRLVGNRRGAAAWNHASPARPSAFISRGGRADRRRDAGDARRRTGAAYRASRRSVPAGRRSRSARIDGPGLRAYLAVRGGFDVPRHPRQPLHLHAGQIRRACGGALQAGDVLHLATRRRAGRACSRARAAGLTHDMGDRRALRAARRAGLFHRTRTSRRSSRPIGKCTTTAPAPAFA